MTEGTVSNAESKAVADAMQLETKITGAKKATFVPRAAAAHEAGLSAGKTGAMYGAGFSLGSNLVDVARGKKDIGDAAVAVAKDTAISAGAGYVAGAAGSAIAGTSAGASAIAAAGSVGSAVAGTTVGGAVIGAATAAAPVVAVGAAVGVGYKVLKSIFSSD